MILKATVRLSHPAPMDLILRKRLCIVIYKRQSLTDRIIKRIVKSDYVTKTGVTYEIVSNIPKVMILLIIMYLLSNLLFFKGHYKRKLHVDGQCEKKGDRKREKICVEKLL